jgi:urease accessory protein
MAQLTVSSITRSSGFANARLVLPFDLRQRSRLLASIDSGEEIGLTLPRGTVLRGGDRLQASDGRIIEVVAAPERVAIVQSDDPRLLARAAYHLGNRRRRADHQQLAAFPEDHVLEGMLQQLSLSWRS